MLAPIVQKIPFSGRTSMAHSGFTQYSHRDFIKQLRQLLQDRYTWDSDGFAVLKELIQNANDAGATRLDLGWHSPRLHAAYDATPSLRKAGSSPSVPHPLLAGPALFAINNGSFTQADASNITRLGSNSKAGDTSTAGRFGLGLKSVFHLCEAFFYLATPFDDSHGRLCRIFNPWSPPKGCDEKGPYEHWEFDSDGLISGQVEAVILERLSSLLDEYQHHFSLWIPLRDPEILTCSPIASGKVDESRLRAMLDEDELRWRLAELLPFLHSLQEIRIWTPEGNGIIEKFAVRLSAESSAMARLPETADDNFPANRLTKIAGQAVVGLSDGDSALGEYVGRESITGGGSLQQLWDHPNWPKDESLTPDTNIWREHRVKLIPHGGIRLMAASANGRRARVSFHWCVFLPLGSSTGEEHVDIEASLSADISVFLHGYFFVDSGRKRHLKTSVRPDKFADLDAEHLQQEWNAEIEAQTVWPHFLDVLADFVARLKWDDRQIEELTRVLGLILDRLDAGPQDVLNVVSARRQWLYVLGAVSDGKASGRWMLKPATAVIYDIPSLPSHVPVTEMLPSVTNPGSQRFVTVAGKPRIAATDLTPWSASLLKRVIESLKTEVAFDKLDNLSYLADMLDHSARSEDQQQAVGEAIWPVLKNAFKAVECNLTLLDKFAEPLKRILEFVPEEQRLTLSWATAERTGAAEAFCIVANTKGDLLPIPYAAKPTGRDCRRLASRFVVMVLERVSSLTLDKELLADIAGDLLDRADLNRDALSASLAKLPLLIIYNCQEDAQQRVKWEDFGNRRRLVFCDQAGFARQLQNAIGQSGVVRRIDPEFARKVLGEKHGLPGCSLRECAAVLSPSVEGRLPHLVGNVLGDWLARKQLLESFAGNLGNSSAVDREKLTSACRLLIHGRLQDAGFHPPLFLAADEEYDLLAEKLVRHVLSRRRDSEKSEGEEWRIISGENAVWAMTKLNREQREALALVPLELTQTVVIDLLNSAKPAQWQDLLVSNDEYVRLLTEIDDSNDDLLRRLPIHPAVDGRKVSIVIAEPPQFFWDGGYQLSQNLAADITILKPDRRKPVLERQKQLAPLMDHDEAIRLALNNEDPTRHWRSILAAIEKYIDQPPEDITQQLQTQKWFSTSYGPCCRADLICLTLQDLHYDTPLSDEFQSQINRLVEKCDGAFVPDWLLDDDLLKQLTRSGSVTCQRLREWDILPNATESLQHLSLLLAESPENNIGCLPRDQFVDWLSIPWDIALMPTHGVLKSVADRFGNDLCFQYAASEIRDDVDSFDRLIRVLQTLASKHEQAETPDGKERILRIFLKYFDFLLLHQECSGVSKLRPLRLLSQAGTWMPCSELCIPPASGISCEHVLTDDLAALVSGRNVRPPAAGELLPGPLDLESESHTTMTQNSSAEESAAVVERYFETWERFLPADVAGGFIALLGGDADMESVAIRFLGKRSLDETRRNLQITSASIGSSQFQIRRQRFHVTVVASKTTRVTNLLGDQFDATVAEDVESILVGYGDGRHVAIAEHGEQRLVRIQLKHFTPASHNSADDLMSLLIQAATVVLTEAFLVNCDVRRREFIAREFQDLRRSDQIEISFVQQQVIERADFVLKQLGLRSDSMLGPVCRKLKQFANLRAERRHNEKALRRQDSWTDQEVEKERRFFDWLIRVAERRTDWRPRVLRAVKQRIEGHNQYNVGSVLFELFQNADDSCTQRAPGDSAHIPVSQIAVRLDAEAIGVMHFGRRINQIPKSCPDGRRDEYTEDLQNMLLLWMSGKDAHGTPDAADEMTGKFGLGFKSVFLVSERPRILSGRIACEIVGGVFPRYLNNSERKQFDRYTASLASETRSEATVIELPLTNIARDDAAIGEVELPKSSLVPIIGRFQQLAHLLVVFARQIRVVDIYNEIDGTKYSTGWRERPVPGVPQCFTGNLEPLPILAGAETTERSGDSGESPRRALVLRTYKHGGALLLAHDGRRFQPLPDDVPTLWVTAPTRESLKVGFALNARFSLDPGRARIGGESPENNEIAADLGRELGERFISLFQHQQNVGWKQFCVDVGFEHTTTEYEFWDSLWHLIGTSLAKLPETSDAGRILKLVFWGPEGAALKFYRECPLLPSHLTGDSFENSLSTIPQVQIALTGIVARDGDILKAIRRWPEFTKRVGGGRMISDRLVAASLRGLLDVPGIGIHGVAGLADLLLWEIPDQQVSKDQADRLCIVVSDAIEKCDPNERDSLKATIREFCFKNRHGKFELASALLVAHQPKGATTDSRREEERMRATIAPKDRVLSEEYTAAGVAFFELCRERLNAPAEELAGWVLAASDEDARNAALAYLADGGLGRQVQREINQRPGGITGTWLQGMEKNEEFQSMTAEQQGQLVGLLSEDQGHEVVRILVESSVVPFPHTHRDPGQVLESIYKWWQREGDQQTARYECRTYPNGRLNNLAGERDDSFRKDWSILFLLGLTHTMGRTVAQQHRDFLRKCDHEGYLDMIADSEREPSNWMNWIDNFLDRQIDDSRFLQWMKQFVGIYQVSRHLDVYIGAFESVNQIDRQFDLTQIVNPRSSVLYQGGGFDAPPLSRVLGMGQCFVLRELVRNGIITNRKAHRHCYVPVKRVRDLLIYLGCDGLTRATRKWELSCEIHRFLCDHLGTEAACFNLAFDIPLQIIAEDEDLQDRFFDSPVPFDDSDDDLWSVSDEDHGEPEQEFHSHVNDIESNTEPTVEV